MLFASLWATAGPVLAAPCDGSSNALQNGGFENPPVPPNTFTLFPQASVPPWQTTDVLGEIEIWGDGFLGVPAAEGGGFAELNANSAGTLYQDVISNPGDTMTWTLMHRARVGTDTMQVLIGDGFVADPTSNIGWDYISPDLADDTTAWGTHTDTFVVPAGQVCTRFAFRAVSTGSGSGSVGNFLDAVSFEVAGPPPTPTPGPTAAPTPTPTGDAGAITPPPTTTGRSIEADRDAPSIVPLLAAALFGLLAGMWLVGRAPGGRRR
jgi:hypothetical protein